MLTLAVPRILTAHYPYVRTYVYVCGILTVHRSIDWLVELAVLSLLCRSGSVDLIAGTGTVL